MDKVEITIFFELYQYMWNFKDKTYWNPTIDKTTPFVFLSERDHFKIAKNQKMTETFVYLKTIYSRSASKTPSNWHRPNLWLVFETV